MPARQQKGPSGRPKERGGGNVAAAFQELFQPTVGQKLDAQVGTEYCLRRVCNVEQWTLQKN